MITWDELDSIIKTSLKENEQNIKNKNKYYTSVSNAISGRIKIIEDNYTPYIVEFVPECDDDGNVINAGRKMEIFGDTVDISEGVYIICNNTKVVFTAPAGYIKCISKPI